MWREKRQHNLNYVSSTTTQELLKEPHNSPIYDECQTQWAKVLILPWKWAHQDDSNDTPQPLGEWLNSQVTED